MTNGRDARNHGVALKKILFIVLGWLCVVIGVVALLVPILPTTPFLIAAAACFARGSRRFYDALLGNRWCGPLIRNYREAGGLTRRQKAFGLCATVPAVVVSAVFAPVALWIRLVFLAGAAAACAAILRIKTISPAERKE